MIFEALLGKPRESRMLVRDRDGKQLAVRAKITSFQLPTL